MWSDLHVNNKYKQLMTFLQAAVILSSVSTVQHVASHAWPPRNEKK